ncbi:helicase-related protein [Niveispirillum fermenti]|uniref:helicase-related protein n=1 Tax=Niveispirillum fermenti TaxID=1233113 RepID=UPI003A84BEAF
MDNLPPEPSAPMEPDLVFSVARHHPEITSVGRLGLDRVEQAAAYGMVPLGLPLPPGRRDLVVLAERRDAVALEIEGLVARLVRRMELLQQGRRALEGTHVDLLAAEAKARVRARAHDTLSFPDLPGPLRLEVSRSFDIDELTGLEDDTLRQRLVDDPQLRQAMDQALSDVSARLWQLRELTGEADDSWTFENLVQRLYRIARTNHQPNDILRRWEETADTWMRERAVARGRSFVNSEFDFARFERLFPTARALGRRLVAVVGPTNSGKTHRAMQALHGAEQGIYLAPLRLLALEVMDRLNREGTPTTLLTGEEEIRVPGARHLASTIEMLDPEQVVDVAVIDEVQMLADKDRGWAWTAALMGVPARTVYLLGAPEALPLIERVAAYLGEPLEVVRLDRKQPLHMLEQRLEYEDVRKGDALIAFSRRNVHMVRDMVQALGLTAAVIYGALAPEVRRREAERFTSGGADVVVATDAIGMGLNLPIRRVLFTTLEKFDGTEQRELAPAEVKQIAGRAGRYGHHEVGEFGVIGKGTPAQLRTLWTRTDPSFGPRTALTVRPTRAMVARLATRIGTDSMVLLVDCFAAARTTGSPYRVADLSSLRRLAQALDERDVAFEDKLSLLFMPCDLEKEVDARFFHQMLRAVEKDEPVPLGLVVPLRMDRLDDYGLEELSRSCDLYYWASRKFARLFPDRKPVEERRAQVAGRLAELLASTARRQRLGKPGGGRPAGSKPGKPPPGFRGAPRKRYGPRKG